ncbi:MAG: RdgB/HAM1 family non-canonical purine NTP pyrophosphatase [Pseudomonadales bacterium]
MSDSNDHSNAPVRQVVLASGNAGKLKELSALLSPLQLTLTTQNALGIAAAEEPFGTFIENALAKARHASAHSGLPAIADDSGLAVDALGGAPGVHSARYAGAAASDADNNAKLVTALQDATSRTAAFHCVLVYIDSPTDPCPTIAAGRWPGLIVDETQGADGFGYDPHFWVASEQCTAAQLTPQRKNELSHRGRAATSFVSQLRERLQRDDC